MSVASDSEIIQRSLTDPSAFGALFDRHASTIHRYAARRTSTVIADDVMAETFLIAFERRESFQSTHADASPWLFGIATNLLRRHHRQENRSLRAMARVAQRSDSGLLPDDALSAETRLDAAAALSEVAEALRGMPRAQRDTVLLHAWAELSYEQVSTALGVPIGTVRSRLNRARQTLRATTSTTIAALLTGENHG